MGSCAKVSQFFTCPSRKVPEHESSSVKTKKGICNLSKILKIALITGVILLGMAAVAVTIVGILLTLPSGATLAAMCSTIGFGVGTSVSASLTFIGAHATVFIITGGATSGVALLVGIVGISLFAWRARRNEVPDPDSRRHHDLRRDIDDSSSKSAKDKTSTPESSSRSSSFDEDSDTEPPN